MLTPSYWNRAGKSTIYIYKVQLEKNLKATCDFGYGLWSIFGAIVNPVSTRDLADLGLTTV